MVSQRLATLRKAVAVSLVVGVLVAAGSASAATGADDSRTAKPKATSPAPHHSKSHVYGAPVSKPILHKRKKPARPKKPPPAEPIK